MDQKKRCFIFGLDYTIQTQGGGSEKTLFVRNSTKLSNKNVLGN